MVDQFVVWYTAPVIAALDWFLGTVLGPVTTLVLTMACVLGFVWLVNRP